jgi:hypothetical protein
MMIGARSNAREMSGTPRAASTERSEAESEVGVARRWFPLHWAGATRSPETVALEQRRMGRKGPGLHQVRAWGSGPRDPGPP